ncbi:MAG: copper chaperone PCu(A)C [Alphaproteobacteria bacterium]|nr:copper chaperone PCu(A)C [Alphaproteobacteria bacterium]
MSWRIHAFGLPALVLAGAIAAGAHEYKLGAIEIDHPWTRPTATGQQVGAGFMTLKNTGTEADRLIGAESAASEKVELHEHIHEGDVVKMRPVEAIALAPQAAVKLEPGGYHLMLIGLKAPISEGAMIPVTLIFEKAGRVDVELMSQKQGEAHKPAEHMGH